MITLNNLFIESSYTSYILTQYLFYPHVIPLYIIPSHISRIQYIFKSHKVHSINTILLKLVDSIHSGIVHHVHTTYDFFIHRRDFLYSY